MAKRRHKVRHHRRHRKSMGAVAGNMVMEIAGVTAGALVGKNISKVLPNLDPKIQAIAKIALGVALPKFMKSPLMSGVGAGMIAIGGSELVGSFVPALAGTDDVVLLSGVDQIGYDEIGGEDINAVNGDINAVNGMDY